MKRMGMEIQDEVDPIVVSSDPNFRPSDVEIGGDGALYVAAGPTAAEGFAILFVERFAPIFPLVGGTIERWFPVGGWALPNGLTSTALTLGSAATAPLLVWLIGAYGWRAAFAMTAPLGLIAMALWWWQARDEPDQHPHTNEAEVRLIGARRTIPEAPANAPPTWIRMLRNPSMLLLTLAYASMNYVFYLFFNWFYIYLIKTDFAGTLSRNFIVTDGFDIKMT